MSWLPSLPPSHTQNCCNLSISFPFLLSFQLLWVHLWIFFFFLFSSFAPGEHFAELISPKIAIWRNFCTRPINWKMKTVRNRVKIRVLLPQLILFPSLPIYLLRYLLFASSMLVLWKKFQFSFYYWFISASINTS